MAAFFDIPLGGATIRGQSRNFFFAIFVTARDIFTKIGQIMRLETLNLKPVRPPRYLENSLRYRRFSAIFGHITRRATDKTCQSNLTFLFK